jgi:hypothetical protein
LVVTAVALGVLQAISSEAQAQTAVAPRDRQGYYFTLGAAVFGTQQWDHGRSQGIKQGLLFNYGVGQMLTDRWGLGFRVEGGSGSTAGKTWGTLGMGLDAEFNPVSNLALHLGLGVGVDTVKDPLDLENPTRPGYGSTHSPGASWDFFITHRLTGGWSVAPTVMVRYLPTDPLTGVWLYGGLQIANWSGRPRGQLILPDSDAYQKR